MAELQRKCEYKVTSWVTETRLVCFFFFNYGLAGVLTGSERRELHGMRGEVLSWLNNW